MAAAMYSGLISHSESSGEEGEIIVARKTKPTKKASNDEDISEDDKECIAADDDPDFMVSDTPADEFQSADQEDSKQLFKKYKASDTKKKDISDINCSESDDAEIINSK